MVTISQGSEHGSWQWALLLHKTPFTGSEGLLCMIQPQVRELKQKALWSFSVWFPPPIIVWPEIQKSLGKDAVHCLIPSFATSTSSHPAGPFPCGWIPADKLANIPRVRRVKQSLSAFFIDIWTTSKCLSLKWPETLFKPQTRYHRV